MRPATHSRLCRRHTTQCNEVDAFGYVVTCHLCMRTSHGSRQLQGSVELMPPRHITSGATRRSMESSRRKIMNRTLLAATAALVMSTGAVFAAGSSNDPASQSSRGLNYDSGYVFPDDGSPSGTQPWAHPVPQQPIPSGIGGLSFTRIYLYPPAEGDDSGGGSN